jgi:hypothetical protein
MGCTQPQLESGRQATAGRLLASQQLSAAVKCVASPQHGHAPTADHEYLLPEEAGRNDLMADLTLDDLDELSAIVNLASSDEDIDSSPSPNSASPLPELLSPVSSTSCDESGYESLGEVQVAVVEEPILTKNINLVGPISELFPDLI